ncbi:MAG: aromatic amino acid lyase [Oligoflexus sp.]
MRWQFRRIESVNHPGYLSSPTLEFRQLFPDTALLGASDDLITMAPLARLIIGCKVDCWYQNSRCSGPVASHEAGIEFLPLQGRDALALMNGLSLATALASSGTRSLSHEETPSPTKRSST